ncbi:MAG: glycosyltransferase family 2 protein [Candidatus Symbiothrix sp.]|jgi:glycosyltransferase involved in cell wall biosynthesis|nr:glycosyltransferase family 2 protein [Candidatus Symbiothrix sp.]
MLSILLPVYNFPCLKLVKTLSEQGSKLSIPFEIICMDDASTQYRKENQAIAAVPHARYIELPENIGRSRIRNRLAAQAKYDNLLFMDCDSEIRTPDYIAKYVATIQDRDFVSGGTLYASQPPSDHQYYLHWKYGVHREPKPNTQCKAVFTSNNFLIKKKIILKYPFNENIVRYGHEDTIFQLELEQHGIRLQYIVNPVVHIGLETNRAFLSKTEDSIRNLYDMYRSGILDNFNIKKIRLLYTYLCLKKYHLTRFLVITAPIIRIIHRKINFGKHPNLILFDVYKLAFLSRIFYDKS